MTKHLEPVILAFGGHDKNELVNFLLFSETTREDFNLSRVIDLAKIKDNNLKKISSIQEITNNNLWAKNDEALIVKDVSLRAIYDDVISKIKHEGRDFKPFAIHEQIISFYLNSLAIQFYWIELYPSY